MHLVCSIKENKVITKCLQGITLLGHMPLILNLFSISRKTKGILNVPFHSIRQHEQYCYISFPIVIF
jgi:hypothetical protein